MRKVTQTRTTLKSIALRLGVSTATISNAFNRPDQLSKALRERILDECGMLSYYGPNHAARSLRTGVSGIVGVLLADSLSYNFNDPCAIEFLQGVAEALDDLHVNLLLIPGGDAISSQKSFESIPDRFIVYGPPHDIAVLDRLQSQGKPMVTVDFNLPHHLALNIDNYGGAYAAAKHVFERVGDRVGVIGLRLIDQHEISTIEGKTLYDKDVSISRVRLNAYRDAAKAAGCHLPDSHVWHTHHSAWSDGVAAATLALSGENRPHALLCMSDQLALATMSTARKMGLSVPQDLVVVGFDDIPAARRSHPSLSTVYQPSIEKGRLAARMVLHPEQYENNLLETTFKIRESSTIHKK